MLGVSESLAVSTCRPGPASPEGRLCRRPSTRSLTTGGMTGKSPAI